MWGELFFYPLLWRKSNIDQPAGSNTASVCSASLLLMLTSRLPRSPFSNKGFSSEHGTFILYFSYVYQINISTILIINGIIAYG